MEVGYQIYNAAHHAARSVWANLAYCAEGMKGGAYKVSNYMLGGIFRNVLFTLPQQSASTNQACEDFLDFDVESQSGSRNNIEDNFKIYTEVIKVNVNNIQFFVEMGVYETEGNHEMTHTCIRVGGKDETLDASDVRVYPLLKAYLKTKGEASEQKGLRIIQFSLHGHTVGKERKAWQPNDACAIGELFFGFLQEMQKRYQVDSLICHSLGSIVMESLDHNKHQLPNILILDRALASVWKVSRQLHNRVVAYMLYRGALIAGWAAAPEISLKKYFAQQTQNHQTLNNRRVILIEVKDDYYFAQAGAFDKSFMGDLNGMGIETCRKSFEPNAIAFHSRSHHCLALGKLKNGKTEDNNRVMPLKAYESAASGLIKFLISDKKNQ